MSVIKKKRRIFFQSEVDVFECYEEFSNSRAFRRILQVAAQANCNLIEVSETDNDPIWSEEARELARCGRKGKNGERVTRIDLFKSSDADDPNPTQLGMVLLRPSDKTVLHSVLPRPGSSTMPSVDDPSGRSRHFVLSMAEWELSGTKLTGTPFVEQCSVIGSCAHACVSCVLSLLNRMGGCSEAGFPKISRDAALPTAATEGMDARQIRRALRLNGCEATLFSFDEDREADVEVNKDLYTPHQLLYLYVESGFPVIVGLETSPHPHAVVVIGHTFERNAWWPDAYASYNPRVDGEFGWLNSSFWSPQYIVQDDNFGPYMVVESEKLMGRAAWMIAVVPQSLNLALEPGMAEAIAGAKLTSMRSLIESASHKNRWAKDLLHQVNVNKSDTGDREQKGPGIVLRTTLVPRDLLREHLTSGTYGPEIRKAYASLELPDIVWMVEVSLASIWGSLLKLGEFLIDPHQNVHEVFVGQSADPLLSAHIPGHLSITKELTRVQSSTDRPTKVLSRDHY